MVMLPAAFSIPPPPIALLPWPTAPIAVFVMTKVPPLLRIPPATRLAMLLLIELLSMLIVPPVLEMAAPCEAPQLVIAILVRVTVPPLMEKPPPLPPVAAPAVTVRFEMLTVPVVMLKTRLLLLPETANTTAPGPVIVKFLAMGISPLVSVMVPVTAGAKVIVAPSQAIATMSRSEPTPLSLLLSTTVGGQGVGVGVGVGV